MYLLVRVFIVIFIWENIVIIPISLRWSFFSIPFHIKVDFSCFFFSLYFYYYILLFSYSSFYESRKCKHKQNFTILPCISTRKKGKQVLFIHFKEEMGTLHHPSIFDFMLYIQVWWISYYTCTLDFSSNRYVIIKSLLLCKNRTNLQCT